MCDSAVCVCTICRDVKLLYLAGGQRRHPVGTCENVPALNIYICMYLYYIYVCVHIYMCVHIYIYVCIYIYSPFPGRIEVAAGGTYIFYRCCFLRSTSTVIVRLYVYSSCHLIVGVFPRLMHSNRIRKDRSEQVCGSCWIRQGGMNPSGNTFLGRNSDPPT